VKFFGIDRTRGKENEQKKTRNCLRICAIGRKYSAWGRKRKVKEIPIFRTSTRGRKKESTKKKIKKITIKSGVEK